jgi:hypothetical protein
VLSDWVHINRVRNKSVNQYTKLSLSPGFASIMGRGRDLDYASGLCRYRVDTTEGLHTVGRPDDQGGHHVTLDPRARDRLNALRRPGESYSDEIMRLVEFDAKGPRAMRPVRQRVAARSRNRGGP